MVNIALQVSEILELTKVETISVVAVLLIVIVGLIYHIKSLEKKHALEKAELKNEIKDTQDKLEQEFKTTSSEMKDIIQKYYTITTTFLEKIKTIMK